VRCIARHRAEHWFFFFKSSKRSVLINAKKEKLKYKDQMPSECRASSDSVRCHLVADRFWELPKYRASTWILTPGTHNSLSSSTLCHFILVHKEEGSLGATGNRLNCNMQHTSVSFLEYMISRRFVDTTNSEDCKRLLSPMMGVY
jgi:hypothetical protein